MLRKPIGDVESSSSDDELHSKRDQERRDPEPGDHPSVHEPDQCGDPDREQETGFQRSGVGIVERPHDDRCKAKD